MHPTLYTKRLYLRRFTPADTKALLDILSDPVVNRFLPWFPLTTLAEAEAFYTHRYAPLYQLGKGYAYAVCLAENSVPVGYVNLSPEEPYDLGYGLSRAYWGRGIATEAARAVVAQARRDGVPYLTATHDVNNPASGRVMERLGMTYQYAYQELWQPKNRPVVFRLYQMDLDGNHHRTYLGYAKNSPQVWWKKIEP